MKCISSSLHWRHKSHVLSLGGLDVCQHKDGWEAIKHCLNLQMKAAAERGLPSQKANTVNLFAISGEKWRKMRIYYTRGGSVNKEMPACANWLVA